MTLPPTWYRVDRHIAARKDLLELDAQTGLVHTLTRTLRRSIAVSGSHGRHDLDNTHVADALSVLQELV